MDNIRAGYIQLKELKMSKELKLRLLQVSSLVEQVAGVYFNNLEDLEAEEIEARNEAQSLAQEADSMNCPANTRGLWEKQNKAQINLDNTIGYKEGLVADINTLKGKLKKKDAELRETHGDVARLTNTLCIATQAYAESNAPYLAARKAADTAFLLAAITGAVVESVRASKLSQEKS